jgi:hypothetical protein
LDLYSYGIYENKSESYYHSLFKMAMVLAEQYSHNEVYTVDGRYDTHIKDPAGNDFIIELKYTRLEEDMAEQAQVALDHKGRKYFYAFSEGGNHIYKVALVVARQNKVLAVIEEG